MEARWIWFYGDFEIYHNLLLHTRRKERDYVHPPFWKIDNCRHNVLFKKNFDTDKEEKITAYAQGSGILNIDGKRYPFEKEITIPPGKHTIAVPIINHSGLPCLLIEGKSIFTDESWEVINRGSESGSAGSSELYTTPKDNPQIFKFKYVKLNPFTVESTGGGVLYDFGRETFAKLVFEKIKHELTVYCGESLEEVLDSENCYLYDTLHRTGDKIELSARAFRYVFINAEPGEFNLTAYFEYLPVENKATFRCSDELINKIWDTSIYTFKLNSREFYLDGIKRDRWVWSGDAFQSYLIDRYCFF